MSNSRTKYVATVTVVVLLIAFLLAAFAGWQIYNYEQGAYSTITLQWNDRKRMLTIGKREGSFKGMLENQVLTLTITLTLTFKIEKVRVRVNVNVEVIGLLFVLPSGH